VYQRDLQTAGNGIWVPIVVSEFERLQHVQAFLREFGVSRDRIRNPETLLVVSMQEPKQHEIEGRIHPSCQHE
jgi:hypothetical protein